MDGPGGDRESWCSKGRSWEVLRCGIGIAGRGRAPAGRSRVAGNAIWGATQEAAGDSTRRGDRSKRSCSQALIGDRKR